MNVCAGRLLQVDLSTGTRDVLPLDEAMLRQYLLGTARLYMAWTAAGAAGPRRAAYVMTGPLDRHFAPCACRTSSAGPRKVSGMSRPPAGLRRRAAGWEACDHGRAAEPTGSERRRRGAPAGADL